MQNFKSNVPGRLNSPNQPCLTHAEPWALDIICCDLDHAASTSSPHSAPAQSHQESTQFNFGHKSGSRIGKAIGLLTGRGHGRSQSLEMPFRSNINIAPPIHSQPQTPALSSQPASASGTPCHLDFSTLCCNDELCEDGQGTQVECCEDPHCEEAADEGSCCDCGEGGCDGSANCTGNCGQAGDQIIGATACNLDHSEVPANGQDQSCIAGETQEERDMRELERWACTKEGCHAIQQYLDCCHFDDCNLPICTDVHNTPQVNCNQNSDQVGQNSHVIGQLDDQRASETQNNYSFAFPPQPHHIQFPTQDIRTHITPQMPSGQSTPLLSQASTASLHPSLTHFHNHSSSNSFDLTSFPPVQNQWMQSDSTATSDFNSTASTPAFQDLSNAITSLSNVCHWQNCHRVFSDTPSLLAHIAADHLNTGIAMAQGSQALTTQGTMMPDTAQLINNEQSLNAQPFSFDMAQNTLGNQGLQQPSSHNFDLSAFNIENTNYDPLLSCLWDDCLPMGSLNPTSSDTSTVQSTSHDNNGHSTPSGNPYSAIPMNLAQTQPQANFSHLPVQNQTQTTTSQFQIGHQQLHSHAHSAPHAHVAANGEPFSPQTMLRHVLEEHLGITTTNLDLDLNALLLPPAPVSTPVIGLAETFQKPQMFNTPRQTPSTDALTRKTNSRHHHHHGHLHSRSHSHTHPILPTPSPSTYTASPPSIHNFSRPATSSSTSEKLDLICQWPRCTCSNPFANSAALMEHLSENHVGKCKTTYSCLWGSCGHIVNANGEKGREFKSRQKVLRHLQSHTGHKPFVCEVCDQAFSEAAPLQAHMRRHAQEKPFKCEHPGCGKTFAISSSLTIHMRTHNGEKPFICPHCDKGFVEASNLTKHIRTHTGERPFACSYPGCDKRFPRPDQLKRHMGVHDTDKGRAKKGRRGSKAVVDAVEF